MGGESYAKTPSPCFQPPVWPQAAKIMLHFREAQARWQGQQLQLESASRE